jgi:CRISPR-associated protein Csb1
MSTTTLDPTALLKDAKRHRLVLEATLTPVSGDRFQPAGFPEIGHVIYKAPRPDNKTEEVCVVDSAASMANHLEAVMHDSIQTLSVHPDLDGMPYLECRTDEGWPTIKKVGPHRLVVTSLSEGHRLASSYFTDDRAFLVENGAATKTNFGTVLREGFGMPDLGKRSHPQPGDWWNVFKTIFAYDPNSLVHGILFPALGIKIPRILTAHHEAFGAGRVETSGVKFDKLGKTTSGQPIFTRDEETAREIRATFVLDLAQLRSYGRGTDGLTAAQKEFLLHLAFWKIGRLVSEPYRYRSGCDLELSTLQEIRGNQQSEADPTALNGNIAAAIKGAEFRPKGDSRPVVTQVYWAAADLFKAAKEEGDDDSGDDASAS